MDIPRIPSQNRPHDDKNVVQFTNSTESRSSVASRDYLISDSLGLMLLLLSCTVRAEWTLVTDTGNASDDFTEYVDLGTIRPNGGTVKMWELRNFKGVQRAGSSYLSAMMQNEYDCNDERVRNVAFQIYSGTMGTGRVVEVGSTADAWRSIPPGTVGVIKWRIACGRK